MASTSYSCIIRVAEERYQGAGDDFWVLTSEDLPGLLLGGRNIEALRSDTPKAIELLFERNYDTKVSVSLHTNIEDISSKEDSHMMDLSTPRNWIASRRAA